MLSGMLLLLISMSSQGSPQCHSLSKSPTPFKGLHIDLVLKVPDSQECVLEMPDRHNTLHKYTGIPVQIPALETSYHFHPYNLKYLHIVLSG
ncbi:hypothetical protein TNCV_400501 [Trichonephila clavipes]|nr:hypothetical protein TNCV_400501 [Trichonephila clavipes]